MNNNFKKFLVDNDAYASYINNCGGVELENPYSEFDAFVWINTNEGYDYWCKLDDKWLDVWYDAHCDFHDVINDNKEEHY